MIDIGAGFASGAAASRLGQAAKLAQSSSKATAISAERLAARIMTKAESNEFHRASRVAVRVAESSAAPKGGDLMNEAGQLGGELFPAGKIPGLVRYLDRRGIHVHEAVNGSFDGVRGVMTLPRNPTNLNVRHELSHMLDFRKYGDDYYKLFTPAQREQMVLERLKNNRIWDKLNDAERDWSLKYPSTRR